MQKKYIEFALLCIIDKIVAFKKSRFTSFTVTFIFVFFSFPEVVHLSPPIMEVRDVNFRYASHLPWLFRGLNFGLDMSSRVCIVGPNGSGKRCVPVLLCLFEWLRVAFIKVYEVSWLVYGTQQAVSLCIISYLHV